MTALGVKFILALVLLVLSAAFSMAETSFMSLSRLQLSRFSRSHPRRLDFWQADPDRALAALLFMNNVVNAALGVLSVSAALAAVEELGIPFRVGGVLFPLLTGAVIILLGEVVPKVVARMYPERLALVLAPSIQVLTDYLGPWMEGLLQRVGTLLSWLSRTIRTERAQWDTHVIRTLLDGAPVAPAFRNLLKNVIGFGSVPVTAVMVPREEIFSVDLGLGHQKATDRILWSGYSRVPVFHGSIDRVEGMVYAKDLLAQWRSEALIALEDLVRPLLRVPPETTVAQILRVFREGHHHMALVTEAAGRVVGVVTLQDTMEALVGEIAGDPAGQRGKLS